MTEVENKKKQGLSACNQEKISKLKMLPAFQAFSARKYT